MPPAFFGKLVKLLDDHFFALVLIDDHPGLFQSIQIRSSIRDPDGRGRHETVTARGVAGVDIAVGEGYDCAIEEGHNPVNGPGKARVEILPAHGFGERQLAYHLHKNFRQQALGRHALFMLFCADILALVRADDGHIIDIDALAFGKTNGRLGGLAVLRQRRYFLQARAFLTQDPSASAQPWKP